jgi:hypothetical protein
MQLPPQTDESGEEVQMSPEVEARLSPMLAQAAQQLLQKNQQEAQQAQAQQQAQDPIVQMQMQELQIKQGELQIKQKEAQLKEKKLITDAAARADELRIKEAELMSKEQIAGMNAQIKVSQADKAQSLKEKEFAVSTGVDMAYKRAALLKKEKPTGE